MLEFFQTFFTILPIEPHGEHFFIDHPTLMWFTIYSNILVLISYFLIPLAALYVVRKRKDLVYNWVFLLVGSFIFLCGLTHLMHIVVFWYSFYGLQALICIITATVSAITFIVFIDVIPKIARLTSPKQLEEIKARLQAEIENSKKIEIEMKTKNQAIHESNLSILKQNTDLTRLNGLMIR